MWAQTRTNITQRMASDSWCQVENEDGNQENIKIDSEINYNNVNDMTKSTITMIDDELKIGMLSSDNLANVNYEVNIDRPIVLTENINYKNNKINMDKKVVINDENNPDVHYTVSLANNNKIKKKKGIKKNETKQELLNSEKIIYNKSSNTDEKLLNDNNMLTGRITSEIDIQDINTLLELNIDDTIMTNEKLRKKFKTILRKKFNECIKKGNLEKASLLIEKMENINILEKEIKNKVIEDESTNKRLNYWFGFCGAKKSDINDKNETATMRSRFMPYRLQPNTYLGKLDVYYDNFDAKQFELLIKSIDHPLTNISQYNICNILIEDAKKCKTESFNSVLRYPKYARVFRWKKFGDENTTKFKLFQLYETNRPPYFGTLTKERQQIHIPFKNPFYTHNDIDYDYDSDDEWYEEEPGDDLSKTDDEDDLDSSSVEDDDLDGFLVPHGYLSEDERNSTDDIKNDTSEYKQILSPNTINNNNNDAINPTNDSQAYMVSSSNPIVFGINYLEEETSAATNFYDFIKTEIIFGGIFQISKQILSIIQDETCCYRSSSDHSNNTDDFEPSSPPKSTQKSFTTDEIEQHLCNYFLREENIKNLAKFRDRFQKYLLNSFPNHCKVPKKIIKNIIKSLIKKANGVYVLVENVYTT